jgi:2-hydroxy-6-oxonona-2,4-dienedioate hydrolase
MSNDLARTEPLRSVWDDVGGVRIHGLVSAGRPAHDTPAVVFVHGLGVSTRYMAPTMARLAGEYRVAGLDLPGFGRSGPPRHPLSLAGLADALADWLDVREIGPAVFVGNSFGCQVIVEFVTRHPARAVGLVLNAPTMDPAHRTALGQILRVIADIPHEPLSLALHVARDYLRAGPIRLLRTLRIALADRIEEKLPSLAMPVLVVCGTRDPVVTVRWAEEVMQLVGRERPGAAGATLRVISDAAHALPYDDPGTFSRCIVELLPRVGAAGPAAP